MPIPNGTYPIGGPILDISGGPLTPSAALRAAGVVSLRGGKVSRVNAAGDGWEDVPGHVISAAAPTELFEGLLWYDTTLKALKHYNGTAFVPVSGTTSAGALSDGAVTTAILADLSVTTAKLAADAVTTAKIATDAVTKNKIQADAVGVSELSIDAVEERKIKDNAVTQRKIADNSVGTPELIVNAVTTAKIADGAVGTNEIENDKVTTAKLDAGDAVKQDAFLARLNALRRDLNNIATLTSTEQRTLLLALGSLIDGPRPAPSAVYSARTWIDDHDDRAYVCRNRQEVSAVLGGGFADFNTSAVGVEIAENLGDLDDSASVNDYAYTYSDNKWWRGTTVHNSQNVWRETPADRQRCRG